MSFSASLAFSRSSYLVDLNEQKDDDYDGSGGCPFGCELTAFGC